MYFRALTLFPAVREAAKAAVLEFWVHAHGNKSNGAGMLRMQQDLRCRSRAALVHLRQAAAGSLRFEACRGDAHTGKSVEARSNAVALSRGPAARRSRNAGRRHDAAGARGAARRVDGSAKTLREGRGLESDGLIQSA